jgi:lysozyme
LVKRKRKRKQRNQFAALFWLLFVVLIGLAGYVVWERYGEQWEWFEDRPLEYSVHGIDVSRYQSNINWEKVKEFGVSFAFIKATEGKTIVDTKFSRNWKRSKKNGVLRGAYHFYRPSVLSEEQADFFLSQVDLEPGDLPPVLDVEVTDGRSPEIIRKGVLNWMKIVEEKTGVKPILYTMSGFADDFLGSELKDYPLWIASLRRRKPKMPRGLKKWDFWQFSHTGRVVGIHGMVDRNYFRGTEAELRTWLIKE